MHVHQILAKDHGGWRETIHQHSTDEVNLLLPTGADPLKLEVTSKGQSTQVNSPISLYYEAGVPHGYQHVQGDGLVVKVLRL